MIRNCVGVLFTIMRPYYTYVYGDANTLEITESKSDYPDNNSDYIAK